MILGRLARENNCSFYECNGQTIFPLYSESGSVSALWIMFLMKKVDDVWMKSAIEFGPTHPGAGTVAYFQEKVSQAVLRFEPIPKNLDMGRAPHGQRGWQI